MLYSYKVGRLLIHSFIYICKMNFFFFFLKQKALILYLNSIDCEASVLNRKEFLSENRKLTLDPDDEYSNSYRRRETEQKFQNISDFKKTIQEILSQYGHQYFLNLNKKNPTKGK